MPLLLTESLDPVRRELTHQHIEECPICTAEWEAYRETWSFLGDLPEVEVPSRVKAKFLAQAGLAQRDEQRQATVVPFAPPVRSNRPVYKWLAQAAAVTVLVGGAYFTGHRTAPVQIQERPAIVTQAQPVAYSLAESRVLPAAQISPDIQGRPQIQNVQFTDPDPSDNRIGLSFDITSRVTVNGSPRDKSLVRLLSYVLESEDSISGSRSQAIEWVRDTYSREQHADPEIAAALAKVLRNDDNEGVRIGAVETLKTLPRGAAAASVDTREALIEALKSDPNPAVRIKAVEALAALARAGETLDNVTVDTLRQKASQDDENMYVRVKAAEVLSNIKP